MIRIAFASTFLFCIALPVRADLLIDGFDGTSDITILDRDFIGVPNQPTESAGILNGISNLYTGITYDFDGVVDLSFMPVLKLQGLTASALFSVAVGVNDQPTIMQMFGPSPTPSDLLFDLSSFTGLSDVDSLRVVLVSKAGLWEPANFTLDAITAVPETSSLSLAGLASLSGLLGYRRRKRISV